MAKLRKLLVYQPDGEYGLLDVRLQKLRLIKIQSLLNQFSHAHKPTGFCVLPPFLHSQNLEFFLLAVIQLAWNIRIEHSDLFEHVLVEKRHQYLFCVAVNLISRLWVLDAPRNYETVDIEQHVVNQSACLQFARDYQRVLCKVYVLSWFFRLVGRVETWVEAHLARANLSLLVLWCGRWYCSIWAPARFVFFQIASEATLLLDFCFFLFNLLIQLLKLLQVDSFFRIHFKWPFQKLA